MIYNNKFWKGFYPTDQDLTLVRYLGGFWKRFHREGDKTKGVAHQFDRRDDVHNLPQIVTYTGYGEVIYIKYTEWGYRSFYDLLKIIDKYTVLGKVLLEGLHLVIGSLHLVCQGDTISIS